MTVKVNKSKAMGSIVAPPSKSMAHRLLICGALTEGSVIHNVAFSEDIKATLSCLEALGANVEICENTVKIGGINFKNLKSSRLFCNESGSTLRFLIPLAFRFNKEITLCGTERLFQRSLEVYEDIAKSFDMKFEKQSDLLTLKGDLKAGKYTVRGDISSQFISGLMFALSTLEDDSIIEISGAIESASYLTLTIKALATFGVRITRTDENTILIKGNNRFKAKELTVEGDYSNAAFLEALNLFGSNVYVEGLSEDSFQGDRIYRKHFKTLQKEFAEIDISDCPDLGPVLMAVAAAFHGAKFTGTARLKIKESDRGSAMKAELSKFGSKVEVFENEIIVYKLELSKPETELISHNDHRIVMALTVLGTLTGATILGAQAVTKSYPEFFDVIKTIGIDLEVL